MKNTRKLFAIIMAVVMCFSMLSVTAFATDEMITIYFDNGNSNWETIVTIYESSDGMRTSAGPMTSEGEDLYSVSIPADALSVRFQNYLPGQPEEYAPAEGFQSIEFTDLEDDRVYTYETADTDGYELWVGGVQVTEDNADDILGDGTASYNPDTNELYLDGLDITEGYTMDEYANVGIFAGQDLNIVLADGSDNIISTPANELTYGIGVVGSLYITGNGTLYVSCKAVGGEYEYAYADSFGIIATNGVYVEGASVYALGGDIDVTGLAQSSGIYTYGDVSVDFDGALIAEGGNVTADVAYSDGITAYARGGIVYDADDENATQYINISVYDGYLEADGGDVTGESHAMSTGVYGDFAGVYTYDVNSVLVARSGNATASTTDNGNEPEAESVGISIYGGDVGIYAGDVTIVTGECVGLETYINGIYASAYEDDDGSFSGGYISVYCDEVTPGEYSPGLVGTRVNIYTTDGVAIHAEMGIEIGENLAIVNPENAQVSECDDVDDTGYTVFNADGEVADKVEIEPLSYEVTINGINNVMGARVPAGKSLNDFYCEFFEIEDFSEVLNLEKEGYTFGGFYTDEACTDGNEFSFDDEITGDITIYAKWIENAEDNEQGGNEQGGTTPDNDNQNTDKEEDKKPVADPEIPNTDTNSYAWFAWVFAGAIGLVAVVVSNKIKIYLNN